jgi:hypothetical protein
MTERTKAFVTGAAIATLGLACFAKTPSPSGKMLAYDPLLHAAKAASFVANKEVVVLEAAGPKSKYLKIVFVSFGTTQIDEKYFDGTLPLTVKAFRDRSCDERDPKMVIQVSLNQAPGTYLLTDAFKNSPPPKIKNLECYDATEKK